MVAMVPSLKDIPGEVVILQSHLSLKYNSGFEQTRFCTTRPSYLKLLCSLWLRHHIKL